ncbi:MAG: SRPBCC family protein [Saprospiraceae bacterium]
MKSFLRVLKWVGIILLVLLIVGFFLPKKSHIERSIVINAQPMDAFALVNYLPNWVKWSPWYEMEPSASIVYSSPASGNGAWYTWVGEEIGSGKLTLEKVQSTTRIDTRISFEGQGEAEADFLFKELSENQVEVTWMFDSEHGMNPIARWFGLGMDMMLGGDYEKGLANLKREAELAATQSKSGDKVYKALGDPNF